MEIYIIIEYKKLLTFYSFLKYKKYSLSIYLKDFANNFIRNNNTYLIKRFYSLFGNIFNI